MIKDKFEIRPILPSDKEGLQKGLSMLSHESSRQRFFSSRKDLTPKELKFFTEVDQHDHIAYVAIFKGEGPTPAGSARCVRDPLRPNFAELAVTVVDCFQGQGLGTELLEVLANAALSQNITHLYGDFHASNTRILKLLEKYCVRHHIPEKSFILNRKSDGFLYFEMALA